MDNHNENDARKIEIVFIREYKHYVKYYSKKTKDVYLLNINRIIKDKIDNNFIVPNKIQSFILNYEIKKLLDKAINIRNKKYNRIIYMGFNISPNSIKNAIQFLNSEYNNEFEYYVIDPNGEFNELEPLDYIKVIKN